MLTIIITLLLAVLYLLAFPGTISAQVVINEVFPNPAESGELNEFIELFNMGDDPIDISGWKISDTKGAIKTYVIPNITIEPSGYISFRHSITGITLNNDSDGVELKGLDGEVINSVNFDAISEGLSLSRIPDGTGEFVINTEVSESAKNIPLVADGPTGTSTPTPTSTPAPYKATYKINTPKDNQGNVLAGVQIFVDGIYVHHEDDEILQFFNGHECYAGVDCGLGTHTISLRKSGYLSWEDTHNFSAGENPEVNPVLNKLDRPAATTTPTVVPTPTKTPKPTPTKTPSPTESPATESAVLGIRTDPEATPSPTPEAQTSGKGKIPVLSLGLIFGGLCFIAVPIFSIIKNGKKDSEVS